MKGVLCEWTISPPTRRIEVWRHCHLRVPQPHELEAPHFHDDASQALSKGSFKAPPSSCQQTVLSIVKSKVGTRE